MRILRIQELGVRVDSFHVKASDTFNVERTAFFYDNTEGNIYLSTICDFIDLEVYSPLLCTRQHFLCVDKIELACT